MKNVFFGAQRAGPFVASVERSEDARRFVATCNEDSSY
jgi:hypothetical protein